MRVKRRRYSGRRLGLIATLRKRPLREPKPLRWHLGKSPHDVGRFIQCHDLQREVRGDEKCPR